MKVGLEVLLQSQLGALKGRRVGLATHPAAVTAGLVGSFQALRAAGVQPTALFAPEHGYTAVSGAGVTVKHAREAHTGVPIYSLYGETLELTANLFREIDVLVFDMQDVGVRFYTFLSTLFQLVQVCGRTGCRLMVLDRPNPITGGRVNGPRLEKGWESFVGLLPVPVVHGMTLGELAGLINAEYACGADLTVVPVKGWRRGQWFDETGLIWVPTSPGMPRLETAVVYPGMCFLEGTNLSEGRGTALPFELAGAPWLDGHQLAGRLNRAGLEGVIFRPVYYTPWASKHCGQVCQGVQVHVTDREAFDPLRAGLEMIAGCLELAPAEFAFLPASGEGSRCHFDLLAGSDRLRLALLDSQPVPGIIASWQPVLAEFNQQREKYLRYD